MATASYLGGTGGRHRDAPYGNEVIEEHFLIETDGTASILYAASNTNATVGTDSLNEIEYVIGAQICCVGAGTLVPYYAISRTTTANDTITFTGTSGEDLSVVVYGRAI